MEPPPGRNRPFHQQPPHTRSRTGTRSESSSHPRIAKTHRRCHRSTRLRCKAEGAANWAGAANQAVGWVVRLERTRPIHQQRSCKRNRTGRCIAAIFHRNIADTPGRHISTRRSCKAGVEVGWVAPPECSWPFHQQPARKRSRPGRRLESSFHARIADTPGRHRHIHTCFPGNLPAEGAAHWVGAVNLAVGWVAGCSSAAADSVGTRCSVVDPVAHRPALDRADSRAPALRPRSPNHPQLTQAPVHAGRRSLRRVRSRALARPAASISASPATGRGYQSGGPSRCHLPSRKTERQHRKHRSRQAGARQVFPNQRSRMSTTLNSKTYMSSSFVSTRHFKTLPQSARCRFLRRFPHK